MKKVIIILLSFLTLPMFAGIKLDKNELLSKDFRHIETSVFKFAGMYNAYISYYKFSDGSETFYFNIIFQGTYVRLIPKDSHFGLKLNDGSFVEFISNETYKNNFDYDHPYIRGGFVGKREDMEKLKNGATYMCVRCDTRDCSGLYCGIETNLNSKKVAKQITQCMDLIDAAIK